MALDGVFIKKLTAELQAAVGAHIDKIHQPSLDELVLLLRKSGFAKRLLISTKSGQQRVHFTETRFENPQTPPMFCMLLRKHLGSGRILSVTQPEFERLIEISFSSLNEMGDVITPKIIIELISSAPNVILLNENGKIIDALKRSNIEKGGRLIQPGAAYEYPEKQNKLSPIIDNLSKIKDSLTEPIDRSLLNTVAGLSPLVCREVSEGYITAEELIKVIEEENNAYIIKDTSGSPIDFSYFRIKQFPGFTIEEIPFFSDALELFYAQKTTNNILRVRSADIEKLLNNLKIRITKRMNLRKMDLKKCEDKEKLRIFGELLKANLYAVKSGDTSVVVKNFYDENLKDITIPLKPELSPQANAAKFFKDYKKAHTAELTLAELIEADRKELSYIESVAFSLSSVKSVQDIEEIREELISSGYIKAHRNSRSKRPDNALREVVSPSGFRTLIGKNNRQNDYITCSLARKGDMWFHTKNIPGSHVVVMCGADELTKEDIIFAATLAAEHSSAGASSQVPVDYTPIKYVKKPNGAKPGMVIYTTNNTVYVTPSEVTND